MSSYETTITDPLEPTGLVLNPQFYEDQVEEDKTLGGTISFEVFLRNFAVHDPTIRQPNGLFADLGPDYTRFWVVNNDGLHPLSPVGMYVTEMSQIEPGIDNKYKPKPLIACTHVKTAPLREPRRNSHPHPQGIALAWYRLIPYTSEVIKTCFDRTTLRSSGGVNYYPAFIQSPNHLSQLCEPYITRFNGMAFINEGEEKESGGTYSVGNEVQYEFRVVKGPNGTYVVEHADARKYKSEYEYKPLVTTSPNPYQFLKAVDPLYCKRYGIDFVPRNRSAGCEVLIIANNGVSGVIFNIQRGTLKPVLLNDRYTKPNNKIDWKIIA